MGSHRIAVMIGYRDRPTELALLLQSLRTQTYNNFEVFISDDNSGTPIQTYHFLMCIINKMNEEGNFIHYSKNAFNLGVSKNRQRLIELVKQTGDYPLYARIDDDVILEPDYFDRLVEVLNQGYDFASGVTPFIGQTGFRRESKFIEPVGNKVILDTNGNFIFNGDDCGIEYIDEAILPLHHFRSCAVYKSEIHDKVSYDSNLTKHGFREEEILSFKMIIAGYKLGMDTKAIAWHLVTPSGGERFAESNEMIKINEEVLRDWVRAKYAEHGDFIEAYNKRLGVVVKTDNEEVIKQTNLARL